MHPGIISSLASVTALPEEEVAKTLVQPKELTHGDISFPCFIIAKNWKIAPPECAKRLVSLLKLPSDVERAEVVGPYLNFFLNRSAFAASVLPEILKAGLSIGKESHPHETILVEYSSVNISKPFHVGHLRTTLIGHSLDRIYRHLGYQVHSINHLGDWGVQFGYVWAGCELWGKPQNATVFDIVDRYVKASTLKKSQEENKLSPEDVDKPNVTQIAREYFKRLEADDPQAQAFWKWNLDLTLDYLHSLYKRLGVHFDYYTGEAFYRDKLKTVEDTIRTSGILQDSRGALGVDLGKPLGFVRIFTEDGRSLYITRDIAAADYRWNTFKPKKILYVVASPQKLHFQQLVGVLEKMGHPAADAVIHVSYGNVPGISTRGSIGPTDRIWLHTLLDEAHEAALDAYRNQVEKRPEGLDEDAVAESVALGAICFTYLCRSNVKEFNFTFEEALNFHGDTGPYLQYALARLHSIEAKAADEGISVDGSFDASVLGAEESHRIVSLLSQFPATVRRAAAEYEPYHIASLLLDLARSFSAAYNSLRVVGQEKHVAKARLSLFMAIKNVLHVGLTLLGVPPIERM